MENCFPIFRKKNVRAGCSGKEWVLRGRTGEESVYAKVYGACCKDDCDYVVKVEQFFGEPPSNENDFQLIAAELGLGPKIVDSFTCQKTSFIVMEALKQTAMDLIKQYHDPKVHLQIITDCCSVLEKFHSNGYLHGDSHLNNFMVDYTTQNLEKSLGTKDPQRAYVILDPKFFMIDFGHSQVYDETLIREDYIKMFLHLHNYYESVLEDSELETYASVLSFIQQKIASNTL